HTLTTSQLHSIPDALQIFETVALRPSCTCRLRGWMSGYEKLASAGAESVGSSAVMDRAYGLQRVQHSTVATVGRRAAPAHEARPPHMRIRLPVCQPGRETHPH